MNYRFKLIAIALTVFITILAGCGGNGGSSGSSSSSSGEWTWVGGSSTANAGGTYGTKGVAAGANVPGARFNAVSWGDSSGNLWLFGGYGIGVSGIEGYFNDLWKYSTRNGCWTWVGGSSTAGAGGTYGTQGTAAGANVPGARSGAVSWTDPSGNLWLFGGSGIDGSGSSGNLNDLWKYSPTSGEWTWVGGSGTVNAIGTYGTKGTAAGTNVPGARNGAVGWVDSSGNLWLFGGRGYDSRGSDDYLNDLWKYSPASGEWTWVGGSSTIDYIGTYGTQGTAAGTNTPGARSGAVSWTDPSGNLWLFGGSGIDGSGSSGNLNDLWKYSPTSGEWTWVGGSSTFDVDGTYGTQGAAAGTNVPGARYIAVGWADSSGNLWLFGGLGYDGSGNYGNLNDLWKYSPASGEWTWVGGAITANAGGTYGARGTAASTNGPGARSCAVGWVDSSGNFWLFGSGTIKLLDGMALVVADLNDLWKYQP